MNRLTRVHRPLAFVSLCMLCAWAGAQSLPPNLLRGLVWRNIGPFRGGRVSAVTGVVGQPGVFYMGLPMGGVWKTTSAGATWVPIFDSIREASAVGAIEVAPSDPNVLYVGMGDMQTGGGICRGNGVYRSTDAGATWQHLGLEKTRHIPSILVDPHNPKLVLVCSLGDNRIKSDVRGLYRSTDGGQTWNKTLYVDDETGIQKVARAYDQPNVLLATTIHNYSAPAASARPGPPNPQASLARIYKSTDEGLTWKELTGGGLPTLSGRTCVAVAMNTNAQRMFLVGNFGLFRSDDGGATWRQMDAADQRVRNGQGGYNCGVYVNPQNPDIVYVINTSSYRSLDGGKSFTGFKGAPGGDDPQQLWIDPTNGNRLLFGTDQGATVSLDGGLNWNSWYNQATAQVYHISVDTQYPYWVYGTQQDSGAIGTSSRGNLGAITSLDWLPHPGYEFGSIVIDPQNPKVSYAGGPSGGIIKTTYPSGQWIDVSPSQDSGLSLRKVGNQPLLFSPTNPHELLAGFQYLMATTDGGRSWHKLGPDLSLKQGETPPPDPARRTAKRGSNSPESEEEEDEDEAQRGAPSNAIESLSVSSLDGNVIWVGTNNGLIQLTRDHGATWEEVTIPNLPNAARADISAIDASHQEVGAAYAAVDYHNQGDYRPYLYRTHDFGKSWTLIVDGLPQDEAGGSFARVIRADTQRPGLLFAGTESSVYVSFDDGDHWQSLGLNLPNTSYRDMVVKDNDLVVGTYGRGFWILDDLSPLRQLTRSMESESAHLFRPADAIRVRRNVNDDTPFPPEIPHGDNPPDGVILYYTLGAPPNGEIVLEVRDSRGALVRRLSSTPEPPLAEPPPPVPDFWVERPAPLPVLPGLNRTNWNLHYDSPPAFSHSYEINAVPGRTPPSPEGPLVLPGRYTVTLIANGKRSTQPFTVKNDPRSPASPGDLRAQVALQMTFYRAAKQAWDDYHQVADLRSAIATLLKANPPKEVATAAHTFDDKLTAVGGNGNAGRRFFGPPGAGGPPPPPNFAGIQGTAVRGLNTQESGDMAPNDATRRAGAALVSDLKSAEKTWTSLKSKELPAFNALLTKNHLKPIGI